MKPISGKTLKQIVGKKGWIHHRTTGSYWIYKNPNFQKAISIPVHENRDLSIDTLKPIIEDANLTE